MEVTVIILSVVLGISILFNINLLRKLEANEDYVSDLEDSNTEYYTFFDSLKKRMNQSNSKLKQIDRLGSFEADDEIGFIFKELKDMIEKLNNGF
tara:strand:+ start:90 stop:374 length:285 start_codon:yes stop_codon:yes gene_type:complete